MAFQYNINYSSSKFLKNYNLTTSFSFAANILLLLLGLYIHKRLQLNFVKKIS